MGSRLKGLILDGIEVLKFAATSQSSVLPIFSCQQIRSDFKSPVAQHDLLTGKTIKFISSKK